MKLGTEVEVLERIKQASGAHSDQELARKLGLSKQSIAKARTTKSVPSSWIPKAALLFNAATDWLFFGHGPMRPHYSAGQNQAGAEPEILPACSRCAHLEAQLDIERRECREQGRELREVYAENRFLLKENGKLREELATLREWRRGLERPRKTPL